MSYTQQNRIFFVAIIFFLLLFLPVKSVYPTTVGSEFPIATTTGSEIAYYAAFDGTNYLVAIQGDEAAHSNITAQMVSQTGSLVGSRISIGRTGGVPLVVFDGTNYLMVWSDDANDPNDDIYGQFISTSGTLLGSPFSISEASGEQELAFGNAVAFDGTNYLVIWRDGRYPTGDHVYGQIVSKDGSLVGGEIQISTDPGHVSSIAFDGTNYLVVWVEDTSNNDYYGQFINPSGTLVGQNFVIDSNNLRSSEPAFLLFDGTRYVISISDHLDEALGHYIRFVEKDGNVSDTRVTLYEGQTATGCYVATFDGTNYLAGLSEGWGGPPITGKARFYDYNFSPVGDWFTIFETQDSKVPLGPSIIFDGTKYLAVTTMYIHGEEYPYITNGDVYGAFIFTDTTPPAVSSTSPANNATDVAINTSITATFSETMDSSTITTGTFTVSGSGNIAGTVTYSDTTATFTPTTDLDYNTTYTATITTGAKDSAGNALQTDYMWSFTTQSGSSNGGGGGCFITTLFGNN